MRSVTFECLRASSDRRVDLYRGDILFMGFKTSRGWGLLLLYFPKFRQVVVYVSCLYTE